MASPRITQLSTGYTHIRFDEGGFAQIPPWFCAEEIPDEYIFEASWNHSRVNEWWRRTGRELLMQAAARALLDRITEGT